MMDVVMEKPYSSCCNNQPFQIHIKVKMVARIPILFTAQCKADVS